MIGTSRTYRIDREQGIETSRPKNPLLYKTEMCQNFTQHGFCKFDTNCWYAHNHVELRPKPSAMQMLMSARQDYSTPIRGPSCYQNWRYSDMSQTQYHCYCYKCVLRNQIMLSHCQIDQMPLTEPRQPSKFKTELCDFFMKRGRCKYGRYCWFAHGYDDLISKPRISEEHSHHSDGRQFLSTSTSSNSPEMHMQRNDPNLAEYGLQGTGLSSYEYHEHLNSFMGCIKDRNNEEENRLNLIHDGVW